LHCFRRIAAAIGYAAAKCGIRLTHTPAAGCLVWLLILVSAVGSVAADEDDARFVEGLRQRHLFRLAEDFCRQRLADQTLSETQRLELAVDLVRCLASHAASVPPADRPPLWEQARQTAADFQRENPASPRLVLLQIQDALTLLARGEQLREESELLPNGASLAESAKQVLRSASAAFESVAEYLAREIPLRHRTDERPNELSAAELISLQHQVRYHQARAARNRALCYPADSDDRIAMLTQAIDVLKDALTQISAQEPMAVRLRIDLAVCYRLLADYGSAEQTLTAVFRTHLDAQLQLAARAEVMRLELARSRPERAAAHLELGRAVAGPPSDQFDLACLEMCLAMCRAARAAGDDAQAADWRSQAVQLVQRIEQYHGPYWGRRADLLLVHALGNSGGAGDVEVLIRTADNLYRTGQLDEAATAYDQAAEAAAGSGDLQQAFALHYKAALVEHSRQNHQAAADRLRALGLQMATHERAADVHLLAAWNAAQLVRQDPTAVQQYEQILSEHVARWPAATSSDTARFWLGQLLESQGQVERAAVAYQAITAQAEQYEQALHAAARCLDAQLQAANKGADPAQPARELAAAAAAFFEQQIRAVLDDPARSWTPRDRFCAAQAARFWLRADPALAPRAESVLHAALTGQPQPDADWKTAAQSQLVVALARQPDKRQQAEQKLQQLADASPTQLLEMLTAVTAAAPSTGGGTGQELAVLQLAVTDRLAAHRSELEPDKRRLLDQVRAESLLAAGRRAEALTAYRQLAEEYPDQGEIQEAYADLLLAVGDAASLRTALEQWRRIAARSRPHSQRWYRAKLAVATALLGLGERQEAAERIRYLLEVPPGVQEPQWQAKFAALLERCE
jgi:hypothetical protein